MEKKVRCDSCGSLWGVPQRNGEPFRDILCPKCNHKLRVDFSQPEQDDSAKTIYGGQRTSQSPKPADPARTQLTGVKKTTHCLLRCNGDSYMLDLGKNIIGRKKPASGANVQILTNDKHISGQHAIIKVTRIADGSLKAIISSCKDRLTTCVGGQELQVGDEVVLTSGCNLILGTTTFIYLEE